MPVLVPARRQTLALSLSTPSFGSSLEESAMVLATAHRLDLTLRALWYVIYY